jgi:hypothetical protein
MGLAILRVVGLTFSALVFLKSLLLVVLLIGVGAEGVVVVLNLL